MLKIAIFNDTRPARHVGCTLVMNELIELSQNYELDPVWFHPVRVDWREYISKIPKSPDINAVIVNGEGSIHHSATRPRAVFLSELGKFSHEQLGVPAFLINATIEEIDIKVADNLKQFERIYVRESESRKVLESYGINSEVVPDLTLNYKPLDSYSRKGFCGTDSVIPDVNKALRRLCKANGWEFKRMSSVWSESVSEDEALNLSKLYANWISRHELVITGRFHTVTLCVASKTPFLAVDSNTRKISSFVKDIFGSCQRVIKPEELKNLDARKYAQWSNEEEEKLIKYLDNSKLTFHVMFENIKKIVSGKA